MKIFKREKYLNKISNYLKDKEKILFIIWPRQVWKTTLLNSLVEFKIIDKEKTLFLYGDELSSKGIDSYDSFINYLKIFKNFSKIKYLIIDEIHFIPNISLILKILIDKVRKGDFNFKIIVSGSWSLNVFKWIWDSLVGRKQIIKVYPFSFEEFLSTKNIKLQVVNDETIINEYLNYFQEYIIWWWYPKVVLSTTIEEKFENLRTIYNDYLLKDLSLFLLKWDILNIKKLLKLIAEKIWTQINISKICEEAGLSRYIVEKYLFALENFFIFESISPWTWKKYKNEIKKKEKIYFVDIGILRYILWIPEWIGDFKWKILENFVYLQLNYIKEIYENIYFWATSDGGEIDFILQSEIDFKIIPIEVKNKNKDNFSKVYANFMKVYDDIIKKWIITTTKIFKQRGKIYFLPYIYIWKLKEI